jgi:hypothetical protein
MRIEETEQKEHEIPPGSQDHSEHGKDKVTVTVDGIKKRVHRGTYVIAELKAALDVDPSRALDQVINGEFKPLDDAQRITIKGDEVFVSHVRQGGSS